MKSQEKEKTSQLVLNMVSLFFLFFLASEMTVREATPLTHHPLQNISEGVFFLFQKCSAVPETLTAKAAVKQRFLTARLDPKGRLKYCCLPKLL